MTASSSRHAWLDSALCATRLELPWTADAVDVTDAAASEMRHICQCCPVVAACAAAAGEWQVTAGWWAGAHREPAEPVAEPTPETAWVAVTVGRSGRVLPGARQGLLDFGDAA